MRTFRGYTQADLDRMNAEAQSRGFDAFLPTRPSVLIEPDPNRYGLGATCYCRGVDEEPQKLPLKPGQTKLCPLCGTSFHLYEDRTGIGITYPRGRSN